MQITKFASLIAAAAGLVSANSVTFKSYDAVPRTVYFTASVGQAEIQPVRVPAGHTVKVEFPIGWIGNWYSVSKGAQNVPGMLGEVTFNGWNGLTYFDVSAIVDPNDKVGVKQMWPATSLEPFSGCATFPCNHAYYLPDDVQTKTTTETDLVCALGETTEDPLEKLIALKSASVKRDFVLGRYAN